MTVAELCAPGLLGDDETKTQLEALFDDPIDEAGFPALTGRVERQVAFALIVTVP